MSGLGPWALVPGPGPGPWSQARGPGPWSQARGLGPVHWSPLGPCPLGPHWARSIGPPLGPVHWAPIGPCPLGPPGARSIGPGPWAPGEGAKKSKKRSFFLLVPKMSQNDAPGPWGALGGIFRPFLAYFGPPRGPKFFGPWAPPGALFALSGGIGPY